MERLFPKKNDMIQIGICVGCVAIVAFLIVRIYSPKPCPAGCGVDVPSESEHVGPCTNCDVGVYWCLDSYPAASEDPTYAEHKSLCMGCGEWYYVCYNPALPASQQPRYYHRIVGKREDGTSIHACKPEDSVTLPSLILDK